MFQTLAHSAQVSLSTTLNCFNLALVGAVGRERKSRKSTMTRSQRISSSSSRESTAAAARSTGRSTVVHQRAKPVAVDRPVYRLTLPNSRLGTVDRHGRPARSTGGLGRSTDRSTDRRIRADSRSFLNWKSAQ